MASLSTDKVRETWASIWLFRTYEERSYYKVDHSSVTMALPGWYAMDVELKLDGTSPEDAVLQVMQARPHPGRGE